VASDEWLVLQCHSYMDAWWAPVAIIGWEHTLVHMLHHVLAAVADDTPVDPAGATFEDGYRAAVVRAAVAVSARTGQRVDSE